jgi:hypothetical protein
MRITQMHPSLPICPSDPGRCLRTSSLYPPHDNPTPHTSNFLLVPCQCQPDLPVHPCVQACGSLPGPEQAELHRNIVHRRHVCERRIRPRRCGHMFRWLCRGSLCTRYAFRCTPRACLWIGVVARVLYACAVLLAPARQPLTHGRSRAAWVSQRSMFFLLRAGLCAFTFHAACGLAVFDCSREQCGPCSTFRR